MRGDLNLVSHIATYHGSSRSCQAARSIRDRAENLSSPQSDPTHPTAPSEPAQPGVARTEYIYIYLFLN